MRTVHLPGRRLALLLPALCILSACNGSRPVKIVRTNQSTLLGTLVAMRPEAVDVETAGGVRVTEPRAGIAAIAVPDEVEVASLRLTGGDVPDGNADVPGGNGAGGVDGAGKEGKDAGRANGGVPGRAADTRPDGRGAGNDTRADDVAPRRDVPGSDAPRDLPGRQPADNGPAIVAPADTVLELVLDAPVQSDTSQVEQPVTATLSAPLILGGARVLAAGTRVRGDVTEAVPARQANGRGRLSIRFHTLVLEREQIPFAAAPLSYVAAVLTRDDAKKVGVGAAAGAVIGGIWSKTRKGLGIGAASGAGATAIALSRNNEMRLARGASLRVRLLEAVPLPAPAR